MTLDAYMAQIVAVEATGERIGRQMVLAVDTSTDGAGTDAGDFTVVAYHIDNVGAALSPTSTDKSYIGEGESTVKTGTKRSFAITGNRLVGEPFQDFCLSHGIKYGVGSDVQRKYVYFDAGTLEGEQGTATITVTKDGAAGASDPTEVEITLNVNGTPESYSYVTPESDPNPNPNPDPDPEDG